MALIHHALWFRAPLRWFFFPFATPPPFVNAAFVTPGWLYPEFKPRF